ncbi:MAG TPA: outer membrane lipoprotein carrier protein LolA [Bacteroidales bacterium]|jgi:outer membrane lipoprotein-sorting protein|nr:outer membrane lipoprotein carrier protein LolA [Bacteroidales bacterium]
MKLILIAFLTVACMTAVAQSDEAAVSVLDKFSEKASSAPSVFIRFHLINSSQVENTTDTLDGSVLIGRNKYRLELPDNIIFFNGESSWSYLPAEKEVTITKPDKDDDSFMSKPSAIFTAYKNGYKCRMIEERSNLYIIDMYPVDIKNELIRIRLTIGKPQLSLIRLEYKRRDGMTSTLNVPEYDLSQKPSNEEFIFQKEKYKGVEVVDMR